MNKIIEPLSLSPIRLLIPLIDNFFLVVDHRALAVDQVNQRKTGAALRMLKQIFHLKRQLIGIELVSAVNPSDEPAFGLL